MSSQKIGRYEVIRKLGEGGMAEVHLARDPLVDRQVAVKLLARQFTADPNFRARFQREAKIIAKLEHPHIVPIYDFGEHDAQPFIVMRYMPGGSLADRLRKGPLTLAETARLLAPLASALDEAHAQGIIHRDLKPANILFDARGQPYISDFGIAKLAESTVTFTGTAMIGTPAYMSPEQWRGDKDIDGRTDIYSLGGMVFEMLTGRMPYEAHTPPQLMYKHLNEPPPRILDAGPTLPPECNAIIARAMAKNRDERYPTAGEMARDVTRLLEESAGKLTRPSIEAGARTVIEPALTSGPSPVPQDLAGLQDLRGLTPPTPVGQGLGASPGPSPVPQDLAGLRDLRGLTPPTPAGRGLGASPGPSPVPQDLAGLQDLRGLTPPTPAGQGLGASPGPSPVPQDLAGLQDLRGLTPPTPVGQGLGASPGPSPVPPDLAGLQDLRGLTPRTPAPSLPRAPAQTRSWIPVVVIGVILFALLALGGGGLAAFQVLNRATATLGIGSTMVSDKDGMTLLYVPAGNFLMGSNDSDSQAQADEKPQHTVYLDAFWVDKTEVTNAMYAKCVSAGACQPSVTFSATRNSYRGNSQYDIYPVIYVPWDYARAYCQWAGRRLPTEAQWEKAARGADDRIYPWGNAAPDSTLLNFNRNVGDTTEVGRYPSGASPYGALDMAGNVLEWVNDWYNENYYSNSPAENPQGPSSGQNRVMRGGSWNGNVEYNVRAALRGWGGPSIGGDFVGFRCARSP